MRTLIAALLFVSPVVHADFNLANNGKAVTCYADDNQSWDLSKARTTIQYTVEGESLGKRPVIDTDTDGDTFVSYTTDEGVLTLSDQGDTWQFAEEDEPAEVECR